MAHAGHANVHTNSSLEGHIGQCKDNWLGPGNRNCSQNLTEFISTTFEDVKQRSIEHHNRLVMSDYGIASFQKFSAITPDMVSKLKGDPYYFCHNFFCTKKSPKKSWMGTLNPPTVCTYLYICVRTHASFITKG